MRISFGCSGNMVKAPFQFFFFLFLLTSFSSFGQRSREQWIDSVYQSMNEEERIAQMFMMRLPSDNSDDMKDGKDKILDEKLGAVLFTKGYPVTQAHVTNAMQQASKIPLLVAQDAFCGLGPTLDSTLTFPRPLGMGAMTNDTLVYRVAKEIARQLRLVGVNLNLSPTANVIDKTRELNWREYFGENRFNVAQKSIAYVKGMKSESVLSCARQFPIQGITIRDVQRGIPILQPFVDTTAAYPFHQLFKNGLEAVMPASSELPVFYQTKKAARKNQFSGGLLSSLFAIDWIEKQMNFGGLVIVDIEKLEAASRFKNGEAELFAFQAGNDMLISDNVNAGIRRIKRFVSKEKVYQYQVEKSVRKILGAKYDAGLTKRKAIDTENLMLKLNSPEAKVLQQRSIRSAITVVQNSDNVIPILSLENKSFSCVITSASETYRAFHRRISKYVRASRYDFSDEKSAEEAARKAKTHNVIIIAITPDAQENALQKFIDQLPAPAEDKRIIAVDFGSPFFYRFLPRFSNAILAYGSEAEVLEAAPAVIFGGTSTDAALPVSYANVIEGQRIPTKDLKRFDYALPEDAGVDSKTLARIEIVANEAIAIGGTPGCHVFVARKGKVIYEKSFGYLTYEKQTPVTDSTIYDLASVTKVAATLQAVMFMHDRHLFEVNKKASVYLPELKNSNKKDFTLKDILTHQAGLWPFLPFWAQTMKDNNHLPEYYSASLTPQYPYLVADKLFASRTMKDSLWTWIVNAKIRDKPKRTPYDYKYSDMGFYIAQQLAERILNQPLEDFVEQNFYEPLGAYTTGYLPLLRYPITQIAPTENDKLFRKALLIGTVHDQGAAMMGGTAGHAGLFSSANDLGKLGQMLLQEGYYGGYQYLRPETVRLFTQKQFETSRRGLGWDKPVQSDPSSPTSLHASPSTFGHTGFTGTCLWVDPQFELVYIFLSNRVHPDMTNNKLLNANIRSRIQDIIYEAIFNYCAFEEPGKRLSSPVLNNSQTQLLKK